MIGPAPMNSSMFGSGVTGQLTIAIGIYNYDSSPDGAMSEGCFTKVA